MAGEGTGPPLSRGGANGGHGPLGPEQHQVRQGWPWKSREQAEWAQHPAAPTGHGSCRPGAPVTCHCPPCWCHPHGTEDTRPLGQGCPRGRGPVWIPIQPPAFTPGSLQPP